MLRMPDLARNDPLSREWAWAGSTGAGVRVAIIDSGIQADHPDLGDVVDAAGGVYITVEGDDEVQITPGPHDDAFGHGTACAGIVHQIAPEASITSVRVLGPRLGGKVVAFLAGLEWAIENGFDVINLSLGTNRREWALAFHELCDRAYFSGSLVVTAAANVAKDTYPSLFSSVASVACNMSQDPLRYHFNPEPPTEFLAPGVDIEVSWRDSGRITATGNSYAAPHISGVAALIKSKHPHLRPFQLKAALWAGAANVVDVPQAAGRLTTVFRETRLTRSHLALRPPTAASS